VDLNNPVVDTRGRHSGVFTGLDFASSGDGVRFRADDVRVGGDHFRGRHADAAGHEGLRFAEGSNEVTLNFRFESLNPAAVLDAYGPLVKCRIASREVTFVDLGGHVRLEVDNRLDRVAFGLQ